MCWVWGARLRLCVFSISSGFWGWLGLLCFVFFLCCFVCLGVCLCVWVFILELCASYLGFEVRLICVVWVLFGVSRWLLFVPWLLGFGFW